VNAQTEVGRAQATPETKRQFRKSSFARMCDKQEITGDMMRAAQEIERVYMAITAGLWAKPVSMERVSGSGRPEIALNLAWAYKRRYKPWADLLSRRKVRQGAPDLAIVIDVLIGCQFLNDLARQYGSRQSILKFIFRRALLEYAVMAQWCDRAELDALGNQFRQAA